MTQKNKREIPFYKPVRETASQIIENARASLKHPSRPFTPSEKVRSHSSIGSYNSMKGPR